MNPKSLTKFIEWSEANGVELNYAEPRYLGPDQGFGLVAKRAIRWNEVFLRIPKSLIVTAGFVADLPQYTELLTRHRLEPFPILVLFFYVEVVNPNSSFRAYLDVLPVEFTTPLADEDVGANVPTDCLPARVRDLLETRRAEFDQIRAEISRVLAPDTLDLRRLNWAWHVVNTRCIYVENPQHPLVESSASGDTIAVIPMVDMMNHSSNAQCVARFDKTTQHYVVAADHRCVCEDAELFVCYGPHDNPRLWIEYGFCLPSNLFNRVDFPIPILIALARKIGAEVTREKERLIREAALPCTIYASDVSPSYGMKKNCAILLMNPPQLTEAKKLIYGEPAKFDDNTEVLDLTYKLVDELNGMLKRRAEAAPAEYRHFWVEQTEILENLLKLRDEE